MTVFLSPSLPIMGTLLGIIGLILGRNNRNETFDYTFEIILNSIGIAAGIGSTLIVYGLLAFFMLLLKSLFGSL